MTEQPTFKIMVRPKLFWVYDLSQKIAESYDVDELDAFGIAHHLWDRYVEDHNGEEPIDNSVEVA